MVDFGNTATSMRSYQLDTQMNFENLYNKSKYLKGVNTRLSQSRRANAATFKPKTYEEIISITKGDTIAIRHRLGSTNFNLTATDKLGKKVNLKYKIVSPSEISFISKIDSDSISISMITFDPNERTAGQKHKIIQHASLWAYVEYQQLIEKQTV